MQHILQKLPEEVKRSLYSLSGLGIPDLAWSLDDISDVLRALKDTGLAILGGDVYAQEAGRVRPTFDSWHCDRDRAESYGEYVRRCWQSAWEYTLTYPREVGHDRYVSLVFSDDPGVGLKRMSSGN
jgi:hypothetical protein